MIAYRFAHKNFITDLTGTGAKINGGRWNNIGIPVLYCTSTISLGLLEMLVNTATFDELKLLQLATFEIPDTITTHEINCSKLKKNWYLDIEYTNFIGSEILQAKKHLVIKCPSAIVHTENNFLLNPLHKDFKKIKLKTISNFYFDERLISQ